MLSLSLREECGDCREKAQKEEVEATRGLGRQVLAGSRQALLTTEGHGEVTAPSPVGGGSDCVPDSPS